MPGSAEPGGRLQPRPPTPDGSSPYVDYQGVASKYRTRRALPDDVLEKWGVAVRRYLPEHRLRVADVGAGTGIFTDAWMTWTSAAVIAVEPSVAMIAEATRAEAFLRGIAEALPLADASVDVVWVSTALHHFSDVTLAVAEFRRVLRHGGVVLIRTHLPERTALEWFDQFPGHSRAFDRFPRVDELTALFAEHHFSLISIEEVIERESSFAASADWAESMRNADTLMTALTDEEVSEGLRRLRAERDRVARTEVSLVVFKKG